MELIKDTTKRETKDLRIERINKLRKIGEIKTVFEELKTKIKFNALVNNSDIRLIKGSKLSILNIAEHISNEKNLRVNPID